MPGDIQIDFDRALKKWARALTKYVKVTKKDIADVINKKLLFVARRALKLTPKASKAEIEHELGVVAYRVSISKKTGEFKARRKIIKGRRAENIIQGSRIKAGKPPLTASEAKKQGKKLLRSRLRAIGSEKSGWAKIIKTLSRAVRFGASLGRTPRIKHKGRAKAAKPKRKIIEAFAEYAVHIKRGGKLVTDPRVVTAAARALRIEARDTGRNIAKRMAKNWKR